MGCKNNVLLITLPLRWIHTIFCFPCLQTHCFQQGPWIDGNLPALLNTFIVKTKENKQIFWGENRLEVTCLDISGISLDIKLALTELIKLCLEFHISFKTYMYCTADRLLILSVLWWVSPVRDFSSPGSKLSTYRDGSIPRSSLKGQGLTQLETSLNKVFCAVPLVIR